MDDDALKHELMPKLCENNKNLMESIRSKMSENTILCKIFIRSLSYDTQDKTVYDMFTKFGNVKEAVIVKDRQTGKSRGFGFITMSNASEAQSALVEHRKMIDGREAICNLASKPQGQKTGNHSKSGPGTDRNISSGNFHSERRASDHSSRAKRGDSSPPNHERYQRVLPPHPPTTAAYPHYAHGANPYNYDYNAYAQYPHYAHSGTPSNAQPATVQNTAQQTQTNNTTQTQSVPYNPYNPYNINAAQSLNPYNRAATNTPNTTQTQNAQNANTTNSQQPNTNIAGIANQPYVPSSAPFQPQNIAAFGANPYRFQ